MKLVGTCRVSMVRTAAGASGSGFYTDRTRKTCRLSSPPPAARAATLTPQPPDESEGRSGLPGLRWFGDALRSIRWRAGLWKTVTARSTVEMGGRRNAATQKVSRSLAPTAWG